MGGGYSGLDSNGQMSGNVGDSDGNMWGNRVDKCCGFGWKNVRVSRGKKAGIRIEKCGEF